MGKISEERFTYELLTVIGRFIQKEESGLYSNISSVGRQLFYGQRTFTNKALARASRIRHPPLKDFVGRC
jgi:hypothetical protein